MHEIERKWLLTELPKVGLSDPIKYERYILESASGKIIRVQRKGSKYEYEEKTQLDNGTFEKVKRSITLKEFEKLKSNNIGCIIRDSYQSPINPNIAIKVYKDRFEGLIRAEVEFDSIEERNLFEPLGWFGTEITNTPLGLDSELIKLSPEEFKELINQLK